MAKGDMAWRELMTPDPQASSDFLCALMGWEVQLMATPGGDYRMLGHEGEQVMGLMGLDAERQGAGVPAHWVLYLEVESLAETTSLIESKGGSLRGGAMPMPGVGTMQFVADPEGAGFALFEPENSSQSGRGGGTANVPGKLFWNELIAENPKAMAAFYSEIFGYTPTHETPMDYWLLNRPWAADGGPEAGMMAKANLMGGPAPDMPSLWGVYFGHANVDAAAQHAVELGGSVEVPVFDVPEVARFLVLRDPAGAYVSLATPPAHH